MLYDSKKWDKELPGTTDGFKTARQLGLRKAEYGALVKTLGRFERGEIPPLLFTMEEVGQPECGTAGCICGWAREGNFGLFGQWANHRGLLRLFSPDQKNANHPGWKATPQQAAVVIRNYLTDGTPKWDEVVGIA